MQPLQIVQSYPSLLRPAPFSDPLQAALRLRPQVDMPMYDGQFVELVQISIKPEVEFELHLAHYLLPEKQLREDLLISHDAPLGEQMRVV